MKISATILILFALAGANLAKGQEIHDLVSVLDIFEASFGKAKRIILRKFPG